MRARLVVFGQLGWLFTGHLTILFISGLHDSRSRATFRLPSTSSQLIRDNDPNLEPIVLKKYSPLRTENLKLSIHIPRTTFLRTGNFCHCGDGRTIGIFEFWRKGLRLSVLLPGRLDLMLVLVLLPGLLFLFVAFAEQGRVECRIPRKLWRQFHGKFKAISRCIKKGRHPVY